MDHFLSTYQRLDKDTLHLLGEIYTPEIHFIDPAHEIFGLEQLTSYFTSLYLGVESIEFVFDNIIQGDDSGYVQWEMAFAHKKLAGARKITVPGTTFVRFKPDGRVFHHRDFFDLGAMLYEHLPLLGGLLTRIRRRLGK